MSNAPHRALPVKRCIDECSAGSTGSRGKDIDMRWVASMVADVHRKMNEVERAAAYRQGVDRPGAQAPRPAPDPAGRRLSSATP